MKDTFIKEDFLLGNDFARMLYHDHARKQPIIDYHCHLPPKDIAQNTRFENLTEIWLAGDHYKWRAMRTLGVDEKYITGNAGPKEKFRKWAHVVPYTLRNPLFHWSALELKRYFDIDSLLNPDSADDVYNRCNTLLATPEFSTQELLSKMNVEVVCTTDDPLDSLEYHKQYSSSSAAIRLIPAFRPDKAYAVDDAASYKIYIQKLGDLTGKSIRSFQDLLTALSDRIEFFHLQGCRLSDHGLEFVPYFKRAPSNTEDIFARLMAGNALEPEQIFYFKYATLLELCRMYHKKGWTQQFHLGALRNNNTRMLKTLGPDTGFDSVGDFSQATTLSRFLNELDCTDQLAKTIMYNLNPADNEVLATMTGNFNDGSTKGKMQFGTAWWFLDQKDGMEKQINTLSNLGLISCFIGMITDSRSFLSYPRHEYFRRILCNLLGQDVARGELPADEKWLGKLVEDICYNNAKEYFTF